MAEEFLDVFDENGNKLGFSKEKSEIYKNGDWYRSAHVWIIAGKKILLQKRAPQKKFFPNCFDVGCAGHVRSGESDIEAARRELSEELGLDAAGTELLFLGKRKQVSINRQEHLISNAIMSIFLFRLKCDLKGVNVEKNEISEIRLFELDELDKLLRESPEMFVDDKDYFFEMIGKIRKILEGNYVAKIP